MLKYFFIAAQILVLIIVAILLWQIWGKIKSIPEDEVIGTERTKYMTRRLTWIGICSVFIAVVQIVSTVLRTLEII